MFLIDLSFSNLCIIDLLLKAHEKGKIIANFGETQYKKIHYIGSFRWRVV